MNDDKSTSMKSYICSLIKKAAESKDSNDALKFSQAASNAANALCAMSEVSPPE